MIKCLFIKFLICFIIFETGSLLKVNAQAPSNLFSNVTIASPNAASLGKYGDYPVSYHTGTPQISIPIYTVKEGALSVPVSLSYHASGLKVMECASSVGAGWSLNAGGVITRSVMGSPDDRGYLGTTTHGHFSNYGYNSYLFDASTGNSGTGCYTFPEQNIAVPNDGEFVNGHRDGEPDLFFFNFGGYSGKFYFRDDRTPVIVPEEDFKIEPIVINVGDNITGFIITTSDGVKYYFGKNQNTDGNIDAIEITSPYTVDNGLSTGNVISAWYLNKIKTADDQFFIDLIYQPEKYSYYTISMFPVADGDVTDKHTTLVKNYMDGVRLSQIKFSNGNVNFSNIAVRTDLGEYQTKTISDLVNIESKSLDTIKITNNQNACKKFILYHSYFIDNSTSVPTDLSGGLTLTTDTKRLRLDSVQEVSCDNSLKIPPYTFSYSTSSGSFAPRRLTFAQDHWGFYNGKVYNTSLIPTYTVNDFEIHTGADRESSWPEMSYGELNKVTFPTGGYSQFLFEPNNIWANYNYYSDSYATQANIGPNIGQTQTQTINLTTSTSRYRFVLDYKTDYYGNSTGSASVAGMTINKANPHNEIIITPGAGPHTYYLTQSGMTITNHDWATVKIYEIVSTNFQGNKIVGGLRIKSVTNNNGVTGNDSATNYNYQSGGVSKGVLYSRPTYVQVLRNDILRQVGLATLPPPSINGCLNSDLGLGYKKSPSSLRPMQTSQGNHIGYNTVEVSKTGNGKTLYSFYGSDIWDQNQSDVCIRNVSNTTCALTIPNYPAAPLPFEFIRGELKYEASYNQNGNLLNDIFYYPVFENNQITTPAYIAKNGAITLYNLFTARKTKMTTVSNYYPSTGGTLTSVDSVFYESPYHHQVTRKVSTNSLGEKNESKIKYSFDFRIPACEAISDCFQAYNTSYSNALNTLNYQLNTCISTAGCNCKWPAFQSYRYYWGVARKNYVTCRRTNFTDPVNAFKTTHDYAKAAADIELKPVLELQDQYINTLIEISSWKNGQLTGSYFSRFDYSTNPANKVYPNKSQAISLVSKSATFTNASVNATGTSILKDSRYKDEATYKFLQGNQAEIIPKNGVPISYLWDYNKNFPVAQVTGASVNDIAYTSFESDGTGGFTYATAKTYDATSPTGNYCYNLSSGAIVKASLSTSTTYVLSYWAKNGSSVSTSGTGGITGTVITGPVRDGWTYYRQNFVYTTSITLTGSGVIDEIRICPSSAQMSTYSYDPLNGVVATNDPNNKITYYEYDNLGRLKNIKDQNRNITKNLYYNYGLATTPMPALVNFSVNNLGNLSTFSVQFTSKTTGLIYNFTVAAGANSTIGTIPADTYDVFINRTSGTPTYYFQLCSFAYAGSNATFYNIPINTSSCNTIVVVGP